MVCAAVALALARGSAGMRGPHSGRAVRIPTDISEFWAHVNVGDGESCWEWTGPRVKGYGTFKKQRAHRIALALASGSDLVGREACHRCDVPSCVNPAHLYSGLQRDNLREMCEKGRHPEALKTRCPQGHPYDAVNVYVNATSGGRICRKCAVVHRRNWRRRRRAAGLEAS